ncbi:MAG: GNAT family N-acetyltransferase [Janthinobacterium lividum]
MNTQLSAASKPTTQRPLHAGKRLARITLKTLGSTDRQLLLEHFLQLDEEDRMLRFGALLSDRSIGNYVRGIDFSNDTVLGAFDSELRLAGVGHLGFLEPTDGERTAELGVSVLKSARGQGLGSRLFNRAAVRCRNAGVSTLYMHCLSRNATMTHIAVKAGMQIQRAYGESDAYLTLPPGDQASVFGELIEEQAALYELTVRQATQRAYLLLKSWWRAPQPAV